jgi:hypothetical protein
MTVEAPALDLAASPERPALRAQAELRSPCRHPTRPLYQLDPAYSRAMRFDEREA